MVMENEDDSEEGQYYMEDEDVVSEFEQVIRITQKITEAMELFPYFYLKQVLTPEGTFLIYIDLSHSNEWCQRIAENVGVGWRFIEN